MPNGRMRKAVDKSIRAQVSCGNLDLEAHAAPIAMIRFMADFLDDKSMETPAMRYATPASFLSYCDALGLLPSKGEPAKAEEPQGDAGLGRMRGKFKSFQGGMSA